MNIRGVTKKSPDTPGSFVPHRLPAGFYQLAFFTPGIKPAEAISRNWIRDKPN